MKSQCAGNSEARWQESISIRTSWSPARRAYFIANKERERSPSQQGRVFFDLDTCCGIKIYVATDALARHRLECLGIYVIKPLYAGGRC